MAVNKTGRTDHIFSSLFLQISSPEAYTPHLGAIGPYHADAEQFKSMEPHKLRYLNSLMLRSGDQNKLKECITEIKNRECQAWGCYSEIEHLRNEFGSERFDSMLLLDGAFTVEFLCRMFSRMIDSVSSVWDRNRLAVFFDFGSMDANDPIFNWTRYEVLSDLILLENQLPLSILEALFDCTFSSKSLPFTFAELAYVSLRGVVPVATNKVVREELERSRRETPMHLLHLMRMCCLDVPRTDPNSTLPTPSESFLMKHCPCELITSCICRAEDDKIRSICSHLAPQSCLGRKNEQHQPKMPLLRRISVTELYNAGICFERADRGQTFDIKFNKTRGVIQMPHLFFVDTTEVFFRNVIAFEQHHLNKFEVMSYVAFLELLINTKEDVHILEESGLMVNFLRCRENVATICNNFTNHLQVQYSSKYFRMSEDLAAHVMKPWNKWKAMLRRDYFALPWPTMSVTAAVVLLGLSVVQTIASVYSANWH